MTTGDICWLLFHNDTKLAEEIEQLGLKKGDRVILFQDEDDFEVTATLDVQYVDALRRETWVAVPDWSTILRK